MPRKEKAMPVNSFDDYPMSWTPDREDLKFPLYYSLADLMERDIKSGKLSANTKLPPQRELADYLDLNLSTITKAYKLCEMRGLIHAVTGKGTFVTPYANVPAHPGLAANTVFPVMPHSCHPPPQSGFSPL